VGVDRKEGRQEGSEKGAASSAVVSIRLDGAGGGATTSITKESSTHAWQENSRFQRFRAAVASTSSLAISAAKAASSFDIDDADIANYAKSGAARSVPLLLCLRWQADPREVLLHMGIVCAIREPNLYSSGDISRSALVKQCVRIVSPSKGGYEGDAEFLFKVALYLRTELQVRSAPNFLLSVAAHLKPCKPYLAKYFHAIVRHPGDLLETVNFYYTIPNRTMDERSLPRPLRKCVVHKFNQFDAYQLAKYGSDTKRRAELAKSKAKAKAKANAKAESKPEKAGQSGGGAERTASAAMLDDLLRDGEEAWMPPPDAVMRVDLKKLVRSLHICGGEGTGQEGGETKNNRMLVMKLLQYRYPATLGEFLDSGLAGRFNPDMAGTKLKFGPQPRWETELSTAMSKNKRARDVWKDMVFSRRLPALALLRNVRNIIMSKPDESVHARVLDTLRSPRFLSSGITPSKLYTAYKAVDELPSHLKVMQKKYETKKARMRMRARKDKEGGKSMLAKLRLIEPPSAPPPSLLESYKRTLSDVTTAAVVASVPLIRGRTVVLVDMGKSTGVQGRAAAALLTACVYLRTAKRPPIVKAFGVGGGKRPKVGGVEVPVQEWGSAAEPMLVDVEFQSDKSLLANAEVMTQALYPLSGGSSFPLAWLGEMCDSRVVVDTLLHIGTSLKHKKTENAGEADVMAAVTALRGSTNRRMRFISVDLLGSAPPTQSQSPLDVFLTGRDEAVLKAVAAVVGGGGEEEADPSSSLLRYVQDIDVKKGVAKANTRGEGEGGGEPPSEFRCPLTRAVFSDPVKAPDGVTYEREAISMWLLRSRLSPHSGRDMGTHLPAGRLLDPRKCLTADHRTRCVVEKWKRGRQEELHAGVMGAMLKGSELDIHRMVQREVGEMERAITSKVDPGNVKGVEKQLRHVTRLLEAVAAGSGGGGGGGGSGEGQGKMSEEDRSLLVSSLVKEVQRVGRQSSQEEILSHIDSLGSKLDALQGSVGGMADALHTVVNAIEASSLVVAFDFKEVKVGKKGEEGDFASVLTSVESVEEREVHACRLRLGRRRQLELAIVKEAKGDYKLKSVKSVSLVGVDAVQYSSSAALPEPVALPVLSVHAGREPNAYSFSIDPSYFDSVIIDCLSAQQEGVKREGGGGMKEGATVRLDFAIELEVEGIDRPVVLRPSLYAKVYSSGKSFAVGEVVAKVKKAWSRLPPFAQKLIKKGVVVAVKAMVKAAMA